MIQLMHGPLDGEILSFDDEYTVQEGEILTFIEGDYEIQRWPEGELVATFIEESRNIIDLEDVDTPDEEGYA